MYKRYENHVNRVAFKKPIQGLLKALAAVAFVRGSRRWGEPSTGDAATDCAFLPWSHCFIVFTLFCTVG